MHLAIPIDATKFAPSKVLYLNFDGILLLISIQRSVSSQLPTLEPWYNQPCSLTLTILLLVAFVFWKFNDESFVTFVHLGVGYNLSAWTWSIRIKLVANLYHNVPVFMFAFLLEFSVGMEIFWQFKDKWMRKIKRGDPNEEQNVPWKHFLKIKGNKLDEGPLFTEFQRSLTLSLLGIVPLIQLWPVETIPFIVTGDT